MLFPGANRLVLEEDGVYYVDDVASFAGELMTRNPSAANAVMTAGGLTTFGRLLSYPDTNPGGLFEGVVPLLTFPCDEFTGPHRVAALCIAMANSVRGGSSVASVDSSPSELRKALQQGLGLLVSKLSDISDDAVVPRMLSAIRDCLRGRATVSVDGVPVSTARTRNRDDTFSCALVFSDSGAKIASLYARLLTPSVALALFNGQFDQEEFSASPSRGCNVIAAVEATIALCPAVAPELLRVVAPRLLLWGVKHTGSLRVAEALLALVPVLLSTATAADADAAASLHRIGSPEAFLARLSARFSRLLVCTESEEGVLDGGKSAALALDFAAQVAKATTATFQGDEAQLTAFALNEATDEELCDMLEGAIADFQLPNAVRFRAWMPPADAESGAAGGAKGNRDIAARSAAQQRKAARRLREQFARGAPASDDPPKLWVSNWGLDRQSATERKVSLVLSSLS